MACLSCWFRLSSAFTRSLIRPSQNSTTNPSIISHASRSFSLLSTPITRTRPSLPTTTIPTFTSNSFQPTSDPLHSALQVRYAHRAGMYNPSHLVRKRRGGFLARLRTKGGKKVLARRKKRGRHRLSH